jgi:hypothetical protein
MAVRAGRCRNVDTRDLFIDLLGIAEEVNDLSDKLWVLCKFLRCRIAHHFDPITVGFPRSDMLGGFNFRMPLLQAWQRRLQTVDRERGVLHHCPRPVCIGCLDRIERLLTYRGRRSGGFGGGDLDVGEQRSDDGRRDVGVGRERGGDAGFDVPVHGVRHACEISAS